MRRAATAALILLALLPATAAAAEGQESIFEDETELLQRGAARRERALDEMQSLGADTIRVLVAWNAIAPAAGQRRRPRGLRAADPAQYPASNWDPYDELVRSAAARGLDVLFSPSSPVPSWASQCRTRNARSRRACKPAPNEYGSFVRALGTRYSGTYADENGGGALPRVDRWSFWNEPNQPGWLSPQYEVRRGVRVAASAHRYRALVQNGLLGLARSGHGGDQILLGETAPIGRRTGPLSRRPVAPEEFIRELLCIDRRGRALRGTAAAIRNCRRPGTFAVTGFAHHPYTRGGSQPPRRRPNAGEITIGSMGRLERLLDLGARAGRLPAALPILSTEFGFQTNPPDIFFGVPLAAQAVYINESDWIAYQDPRIVAVAQYKLVDERDVESFQTGLRLLNFRPKPAYDAYRLPIWVVRRGAEAEVYGQLRPAADGATERVAIQLRAPGAASYATIQTVTVDSPKGHFTARVPFADGTWRLRWVPSSGGGALVSREADAARR